MLRQQKLAVLCQVVAGAIVATCAISSGMSLGFSAVVNKQLLNGTDHLSEDQVSWFTSVASIATPLGCLVAGPMLDSWGRKPTLLLLNVPFMAGWTVLASAPPSAAPQMYAGRVLTGLATGMASAPATVYLGETAQSSLRGMFVTWTSLAISLGILFAYALGSALRDSWRRTAAVCAALPALSLLLLAAAVPESPAWLAARGRGQEAERSLRRLRGVAADAPLPGPVAEELRLMGAHADHASPAPARAGPLTALRSCCRPEAWKPLLIMNGFFFFQQVTGIYVVVAYAVDVVEEAGVTLDSYLATILLGAVQVVAGACVGFALNKCGRRPMSTVSGVGQTISMLALGLYLHLGPADGWEWVPLIAMVLYVVAGAIGFHTLPWAMLGEVFPARVRGLTAALTTCLAYVYNFVMLKVFPSLVNAFKSTSSKGTSEGLFYFFAGTSLLATGFVLIFLPETHGHTIQEIEDRFAGRKKTKNDEEQSKTVP